jgi:hypothetical protein
LQARFSLPAASQVSSGLDTNRPEIAERTLTDFALFGFLGSRALPIRRDSLHWRVCRFDGHAAPSICNGPHYESQLVLYLTTRDREIRIRKEGGRYWTYCFVGWGLGRWTRLAAGRDTVEQARGLALEVLREKL